MEALFDSMQPTANSKMTRAEAARHASLVRWKKEAPLGKPDPAAIAARVKEILAEKANKGKKKAGKGKSAKPKQSAAQKKVAKEKEAASNRATTAAAVGVEHADALSAFARGGDIDPKAGAELFKQGLVTTNDDGSFRMSQAGHQFLSAAEKGDKGAARDAVAAGRDALGRAEEKEQSRTDREQAREAKKQEREKAKAERTKAKAERVAKQQAKHSARQKKLKQAAKKKDEPARIAAGLADIGKQAGKAMTDILAIKAGARHSRTDQQHIQAIHDSAVACGADCGTDDEADMPDEEAAKAIKGIMDNPQWYASHECSDIMQASSALQTLAMLIQSELSEEDEDDADISQLCDAARTLVTFIGGELDELEGAASDAADGKTAGDVPMAKAIASREDVNPKAGVAEYGDVQFADAKNKKYPIDTADHVRAAWNYIAKEANAAKYDPDEVAQIKTKIVAAWKKLIDKAGPPSAGKAIDDAWLHLDGGAVKAADDDTIRGLAVLYGTKSTHDLERDYYDKNTDLWLDHFGWPRPITYHHGMDKGTRDDPVVGHWTKATVTDEGVWLEGQLDRAHRYYKAVKELARRGYLKISSDSGPQWVIREPQSNGANYIKRWPLVTASVTVTPMEPRMFPVEVKAFLAELGYEAIEDEDQEAVNPDAVEADGRKAADDERARRILLELDILQLEETAL